MAKKIEAFGECKSLLGWSKDPRCRVSRKGLQKRLDQGWSTEDAITTSPSTAGNTGPRLYEAFGDKKSIHAWSLDSRCKVSRTMLRKRIDSGIQMDLALTLDPSKSPDFSLKEVWGGEMSYAEMLRDDRSVLDIENYSTLQERVKAGASLENALTTPLRPHRGGVLHFAFGEEKTLAGWTRDQRPEIVCRNAATLHSRVFKQCMSMEEALTAEVGSTSSFGEDSLYEYVNSIGVPCVRNDRSLLGNLELDIYCPDKNLAIEYNGLYWHSEEYLPKSYHFDKWKRCADEGIQLIQVWEDDWISRRSIVEEMLRHKLGASTGGVGARQCAIHDWVPKKELEEFLNSHHIQGGSKFSEVIALRYEGSLVAVMGFLQQGADWVLSRYATSTVVPGGFSRCLKEFQGRHKDWSVVRTFADLTVSDGSLYESYGFDYDALLPPDYYYVLRGQKVHKFNYRKTRFKTDPNLFHDPDLTESELAAENGLYRVYDAGKIRYVLRNPLSGG